MTIMLASMREVAASDSGSELDCYQELPVVLSASRLSQPLSEAHNAMTALDHKIIVASGFRNIADLNNGILAASIPSNSASLPYTQRLGEGWSCSAAYYYQSAMQPFDREVIDHQPIQPRTDMRVAVSFHLADDLSGECAVVLQDSFKKGYTQYIVNNMFNRRNHVTLRLDW